MSDSKNGDSFLKKVARFVANPTTDWNELNSRQEDSRAQQLEKSELKAMIERKRRNDFVRKQEFDMLRRLRREGLSPEQLAALGMTARLDDAETHVGDARTTRPEASVTAKIDEIEQQMVGGASAFSTSAQASPAPAPSRVPPRPGSPLPQGPVSPPSPSLAPLNLPPLAAAGSLEARSPAAGHELAPLPPLEMPLAMPLAAGSLDADLNTPGAVEVSEVAHDAELDETVIAFANADFEAAESALKTLIAPGGPRNPHPDTWLALFDLYRATAQQAQFESLAMEYVHQFGLSAPQWLSLPQLVADVAAEDHPRGSARLGGTVSWACPARLDADGVKRLRAQALQSPMPWVFDWSGLQSIDAEAAKELSALFRAWAPEALEMRWMGGEQLLTVLREAAPTGVRDADPVFWLTRLEALRLANRADAFDEAAIDYCVTYEVSPPSWERARCNVHVSESARSRLPSRMPSRLPEAASSFIDSTLADDPAGAGEVAHVELTGQLVGDIGTVLRQLSDTFGSARIVQVSCARLIRVDFIAAGDLLNWVIASQHDGRAIQFVDAHRLVALFFGAMGITEHARVQLRRA